MTKTVGSGTRSLLGALVAALALIVALGMIVKVAPTIAYVVETGLSILTWVLAAAIVSGVAYVAWSMRDMDMPTPIRRAGHAVHRRYAARQAVRVEVTKALPVSASGEIATPEDQDWINKGLRDRRLDGFVPEPVHRRRES